MCVCTSPFAPQAQSRELLARLASLGPVRSAEQVEPGVLEAPLGEVSMAALVVVGLPTLMAWDKVGSALGRE